MHYYSSIIYLYLISCDKILIWFLILNISERVQVVPFTHQLAYPNDINIIDFNVEDIFNDDLIPVQMVTDQLNKLLSTNQSRYEQNSEIMYFNNSDLTTAVRAMRYHRHMMNEYMLSSYLTQQIVASMSIIPTHSEISIEKRVGKAQNDSKIEDNNLKTSNLHYNNHKLIEDEGSSRYSSWLKKMATFEDIQNQLQNKKHRSNSSKRKMAPNRRQSLNINVEPTYGDIDADDGLEYLEDGDITGYAYANTPDENISTYKNHQKSLMDEKLNSLYLQGISKTGYDSGYDDYAPDPPQTHHPHPAPNFVPATPTKQTKEIGLKDITDIALTTLAFLSFGMFILQVLMCITMNKDDTSNMVMLPMEGSDNGDLPGDGGTEEIRRKRRSISSSDIQHIEMINNMAKRALFSMNTVTSLSNDEGYCHYYSLCESNKFTRRLRDEQKLWIPIWRMNEMMLPKKKMQMFS